MLWFNLCCQINPAVRCTRCGAKSCIDCLGCDIFYRVHYEAGKEVHCQTCHDIVLSSIFVASHRITSEEEDDGD